MLNPIPERILNRMRELERLDATDRLDGTPTSRRLRQVTPDTGRFLALLAATTPPGVLVEIGTSAGYSTLWLALAAMETARKITTFEYDDAKAERARETFHLAGVESVVELVVADARQGLPGLAGIAFCFLDIEKEFYQDCFDLVVPRLVTGGYLVADNVISHRETLVSFLEQAMQDDRVDALVVPIGKGVLVCRKGPAG